MRTIKFKGKCIDNGEWVYGDLVIENGFKNQPQKYLIRTYTQRGLVYCEVNSDTIGQFTGLYDKNGKEIYEGDIVKLWFPLSDEKDADLNEVRWNDKLGRYELVFICPFNGKENYLLFCDIANMTVIGNIHDNKELLTQTIKQ